MAGQEPTWLHCYHHQLQTKMGQHVWSTLRKQTEVGGIGLMLAAYNKEKNKVSNHSFHHLTNHSLVSQLAVLKRGTKEKRSFGCGYKIIPTDKEEVQEEPPCRELYNTLMNGCDGRYNNKYLYYYQLKPLHFVKGWKQNIFICF